MRSRLWIIVLMGAMVLVALIASLTLAQDGLRGNGQAQTSGYDGPAAPQPRISVEGCRETPTGFDYVLVLTGQPDKPYKIQVKRNEKFKWQNAGGGDALTAGRRQMIYGSSKALKYARARIKINGKWRPWSPLTLIKDVCPQEPTETPTATETATPTATFTGTLTATPTNTATATLTPTQEISLISGVLVYVENGDTLVSYAISPQATTVWCSVTLNGSFPPPGNSGQAYTCPEKNIEFVQTGQITEDLVVNIVCQIGQPGESWGDADTFTQTYPPNSGSGPGPALCE